ncbi:MerR family transcriptional regulator [Brevundimonas sp. S30B]|uniref:MerR family transcriptional regulator n=1 Tax=unclassified Brevundimonas TaxID=2622653 RepID=UPI00107281BF|nr:MULTISPECIES: MerR family transcriptional regulator [unclassified Brevundimonas]QBX38121.1 MerR family transcriptional regulator [Brevundimonas sp. MF30-B]TFW01744.1 MerR family transcriptional regulator [Brevundimonas sp. S30B]
MASKGPNAFRTISEAADQVGVPQHVLRFWETKFAFIAPIKRAGGRRFYRPQDVETLKAVKRLLHEEGFTIKGVQKLHKDGGLGRLLGEAPSLVDLGSQVAAPSLTRDVERLRRVLAEIETAHARLESALAR